MSQSPYIIDITLDNFQQIILEGSMQQPILIDFWAEWCAPCKALMPILTKLAGEFQGQFILAKVNIDEQRELAAQFQVRSVPTVMLVSQGQLVDQFSGAKPESEIRAFLKQHLTNPVEAFKEQIKQLIGEGQLDQAQALLQQAISQLPDDIELQIELARILLQKNQATDARAVLDNLPESDKARPEVKGLIAGLQFTEKAPSPEQLAALADRDDSEARYLKAMAALVQADYEQALTLLLNLLRDERSYQDGIAHKTLLEVFALLGEGNPLVIQSRRKLYTLMY
ncbi:thioredoxin [Marinospirillum alkaliphilum]|uniref:Thioredoxin n=1 Tax=Marinospirillum alkaliphilum DSM 21637 TaxID=1122209 RepID=A0A1K1V4D7_9GAMM|nr:thioredoxin [Marinospirillum alkaliphilum]SFX19603.1 thioredoxin [Marinospirillum alkaliphilum DSM 21637]